jgi:hypothetical protein
MSDGDITGLLEQLSEVPDDSAGDWIAVLERARLAPAPESSRQRSRRLLRRPRRGLVLVGAMAAVAAVVALTIESPWRGAPSIIDRAAAAILRPTAGQVLYERISLHPEGRLPPIARHVHIPLRIWLDGAPPHRFRMTFLIPVKGYGRGEVGGLVGRTTGLSYAYGDRVLDPMVFLEPVTQASLDPAAFVRTALTSGRARVEGRTTIRGRKVLRIVVGTEPGGRGEPVARLFVDTRTYRPVRIAINTALNGLQSNFSRPAGFPLTCITPLLAFACVDAQSPADSWVYDFEEYRYLPATEANRKLTSIRAMHPGVDII